MVAAEKGRSSTVETLVNHGARVDLQDKVGFIEISRLCFVSFLVADDES